MILMSHEFPNASIDMVGDFIRRIIHSTKTQDILFNEIDDLYNLVLEENMFTYSFKEQLELDKNSYD